MNKRAKILDYLEIVAPVLPAPIYWVDTNGASLGANDLVLRAIGFDSYEELRGKTLYDYYPKDLADNIMRHIGEVIKAKKILSNEDKIVDVTTGKVRYFNAIRGPLFDDEGKVIGVVGTSIEITAEKEAEQLRVEAMEHNAIVQEHNKFRSFIGKMVHDIRAPLSSMRNLIQRAKSIPEKERIALRSATMTFAGIAEHMLNKYSNRDKATEEQRQPLLTSVVLEQVLNERRFEHQGQNISFELKVQSEATFNFINIEPIRFKRMLSNIINNAVDAALKEHQDSDLGKVAITLSGENTEGCVIRIADNGVGMSSQTLDKIRAGMSFTEHKEDGHGIGMVQVRETIADNLGTLEINSKLGSGTTIIITLPYTRSPLWFTSKVKVAENSIIIILDDEPSTHESWKLQLLKLTSEAPTIKIYHFKQATKALKFINNMLPEEKERVCLLSDYELLNGKLNGLELIKQSGIKHSILVTSYYDDNNVQNQAIQAGVSIIPKDITHKIEIKLDDKQLLGNRKVDAVWIEDAFLELRDIIEINHKHLKIDLYEDPISFLEDLEQYPVNTKVIFDYYFYFDYDERAKTTNGLTLAEQLYNKGYTDLYLCTAEDIPADKIPRYT